MTKFTYPAIAAVALSGWMAAQSPAVAPAQKSAQDALYQSALSDANAARWNEALAKLDQLLSQAQANLNNADAVMYWKAYSQSKLNERLEALGTLDQLTSKYPHSGWDEDARALELQLRQDSGQKVSPNAQPNDDLKLLAINGLMQTDPAEALPLLQKVVNGNASEAVKSRALFVMSQQGTVGTDELAKIAQSHADPKLAMQAVRYLGMNGGNGLEALAKIYPSGSTEMKSAILRSYMLGGDRARLLAAAKVETNPQLQQEAVRELGLAGGKSELWSLYQAHPPAEVKRSIIRSLGLAGDSAHMAELAKTETNPELRADVIRNLGLFGGDAAQTALAGMYTGASDRKTSEAVIQGLFLHNNASALVALARKEADPELKRDLVQKLSLMHSKVATDYLLEILNQ